MNRVYGFEGECKAKYNERVFKLFSESFSALPLATLIGTKYLVLHGGLFSDDKINLDDIRKLNRHARKQPGQEGLMMEMLWTDPQTLPGRGPSKRGVGLQFGPDITKAFCERNGLEAIIRSHEVRMGGYEVEHDGRCITGRELPLLRQRPTWLLTSDFIKYSPRQITWTPLAIKVPTSILGLTTNFNTTSSMLWNTLPSRRWHMLKARLCR